MHSFDLRVRKAFALLAALTAVASSARGAVYENTRHLMTAGDFLGNGRTQIVYIGDGGQLWYTTGKTLPEKLLPGVNATRVVAADFNGDSREDLAVVDANQNNGGMLIHDFGSATTSGPHGGSIQDISAADVNGNGDDEAFVSNTADLLYLFDNGSFSQRAGAAQTIGRGESTGENIFVRNGDGNLYRYNANNTYNQWPDGGQNVREFAFGNFDDVHPNDELWFNVPGGAMYYWDGSNVTAIPGNGYAFGIGRLDGDLPGGEELGYVIGSVGSGDYIYQSQPNNPGAFSLVKVDGSSGGPDAGQNFGWADLLVADFDGDGLDELFARRIGDLDNIWRFENGASSFVMLAPEPGTLLVWSLLAAMGIGLGWRRKN